MIEVRTTDIDLVVEKRRTGATVKNTAKQFVRWVRSAALLARTDVGLVVVSVGLAFPLIGCQERGNRSEADKEQTDSTAPVKAEPQALQAVDGGQELLTLKGHSQPVTSVAFSSDGKRLASASFDNTVKVWDATNGQETLTLNGHTQMVFSVAFGPDGKRLASASFDQTVKLWDATSGQEALTLNGHTGPVNSVAFSADGKRLASASKDQTVKVWNATNGQETLTLKGHTGPVTSVAFSPDGKWLASASVDQTVKVWDVTPRP